MKYSIVTQPTQEPVSLSEFKDHARVDSADEDGRLAGYVFAARQWVESISGLALMTQTLDAYYDYFCSDELELPIGPAQSITSVSYVDTAGATQTVSSSEYLLNSRDRINTVRLLDGYTWPQVREQRNAVTVRYVAGVSAPGSVAEPVRHAILFYARYLYDQNDGDRVTAEALIAPWRVWF